MNDPFQTCNMWFASWTHNNGEMNLTFHQKGGLDLSTFQEDFKEISAWDIYDTGRLQGKGSRKVIKGQGKSSCCKVVLISPCCILTMPCVFFFHRHPETRTASRTPGLYGLDL